MLLVYLSATTTSENKNVVRAKIIHNGTQFEQTQLLRTGDIGSAKLLFLEKVLKRTPWTKESVTVFLNDDQLYEEHTSHSFKNEQWPAVNRCQDFFSLVISFRNKGVLSEFLQEELENEFCKSFCSANKSMLY